MQLNDVEAKDILIGLALENTNKNFIDLKLGTNYNVNNTWFSLEDHLNKIYKKQQYYAAVDYDFTKRLNFNMQFHYFIYSDNQFTTHLQLPIWNMAISYQSRTSHNILKLLLIDLLDKNVDFQRRGATNYFKETTSES